MDMHIKFINNFLLRLFNLNFGELITLIIKPQQKKK